MLLYTKLFCPTPFLKVFKTLYFKTQRFVSIAFIPIPFCWSNITSIVFIFIDAPCNYCCVFFLDENNFELILSWAFFLFPSSVAGVSLSVTTSLISTYIWRPDWHCLIFHFVIFTPAITNWWCTSVHFCVRCTTEHCLHTTHCWTLPMTNHSCSTEWTGQKWLHNPLSESSYIQNWKN